MRKGIMPNATGQNFRPEKRLCSPCNGLALHHQWKKKRVPPHVRHEGGGYCLEVSGLLRARAWAVASSNLMFTKHRTLPMAHCSQFRERNAQMEHGTTGRSTSLRRSTPGFKNAGHGVRRTLCGPARPLRHQHSSIVKKKTLGMAESFGSAQTAAC